MAASTTLLGRVQPPLAGLQDFLDIKNLQYVYIQIYGTFEENDTPKYVNIDLTVHMIKIEFSIFQFDGIL